MKEGIFAGHHSFALPLLDFASLVLASLTPAPHALTLLALAPLALTPLTLVI